MLHSGKWCHFPKAIENNTSCVLRGRLLLPPQDATPDSLEKMILSSKHFHTVRFFPTVAGFSYNVVSLILFETYIMQ